MKVLVFDTETTGLVPKNESFYNTEKWPYIVQLSFVLYDIAKKKTLDSKDYIVKIPNEISIPKDSTDVHGIDKEKSEMYGVEIKEVLYDFKKAIKQADLIVAHNISFDKRIIIVESIRNKIPSLFFVEGKQKPEYCSMKSSIDICKIERTWESGEKYYKFPTLLELHKHLFDETPENLHDAMTDVLVCLRCYCYMKHNFDPRYIGCKEYKKQINRLIAD